MNHHNTVVERDEIFEVARNDHTLIGTTYICTPFTRSEVVTLWQVNTATTHFQSHLDYLCSCSYQPTVSTKHVVCHHVMYMSMSFVRIYQGGISKTSHGMNDHRFMSCITWMNRHAPLLHTNRLVFGAKGILSSKCNIEESIIALILIVHKVQMHRPIEQYRTIDKYKQCLGMV